MNNNRRQLVRRIGWVDDKPIGVTTGRTEVWGNTDYTGILLKTAWGGIPAGAVAWWADGKYVPARTDPRRSI